jgi:hypothetical protein
MGEKQIPCQWPQCPLIQPHTLILTPWGFHVLELGYFPALLRRSLASQEDGHVHASTSKVLLLIDNIYISYRTPFTTSITISSFAN